MYHLFHSIQLTFSIETLPTHGNIQVTFYNTNNKYNIVSLLFRREIDGLIFRTVESDRDIQECCKLFQNFHLKGSFEQQV